MISPSSPVPTAVRSCHRPNRARTGQDQPRKPRPVAKGDIKSNAQNGSGAISRIQPFPLTSAAHLLGPFALSDHDKTPPREFEFCAMHGSDGNLRQIGPALFSNSKIVCV